MMLSGEWRPYSGTWPNAILLYKRSVFELPTWEPPTAVNVFSFWPTANAHDATGERGPGFAATDRHYKPHDLATAADQWRTPDAPGSGGPRNRQGSTGQGHQITIGEQAEKWATPATPNGGRVMSPADVAARGATAAGKRQVGLESETRHWATPAERDYRSPNHEPYSERGGGTKGEQLGNQASFWEPPAPNWPTPRAEDSESCGNHPGASDSLTGATRLWSSPAASTVDGRGSATAHVWAKRQQARMSRGEKPFADPLHIQTENWGTPRATTGQYCNQRKPGETILTLQGQAESFQSSPSDQPTPDGPTCWCASPGCDLPSHRRKLNPLFETWLMGWPLFWLTNEPRPFARSEMESYRFKLRSAFEFLCSEWGW